jgi:23S rRNA pseudouridine955/2504/2580 synthase
MLDGFNEIITGFRTLDSRNGLWLIECTLYTGRTHQIRAHLAHLNAPILGDTKYGDSRMNSRYGYSRQLLTSYSISFPETDKSALTGLSGKTFRVPETPFTDLFPEAPVKTST